MFGHLPIDFRVSGNDRGYIRYPHQAFPKMLCAVNAIEDEFVFQAQRRHFLPVDDNRAASGKQILDRHRLRVITEGVFGVQFDDTLRGRPAEQVFTGYFSGTNSDFRNVGMKPHREHAMNSMGDVAMAQEQVQVHVAADGRVTVGQNGNQWTFHENGVDKIDGEILEYAKEFSGHAQAEQMLRAHAYLELLADSGGHTREDQFFQTFRNQSWNAVGVGKVQQGLPVETRLYERGNFGGSGLRGSAPAEKAPLFCESQCR